MKQKIFLAALLITTIAISCKSRFTSTSDSTGPRRHDHADHTTTMDPSHSDPSHSDTIHNLTEIRDSGNLVPILTRADSLEVLAD